MSDPKTRSIAIGILLVAAVVGGSVAYLHEQGVSHHRAPLEFDIGPSGLGTIDHAILGEDGAWLLWTDNQKGLVSAYNLENPGNVTTFRTFSHLRILPAGVISNHLFLLRSSLDRSFLDQIRFGFKRTVGGGAGSSNPWSAEDPVGKKYTTYLECLDLENGALVSQVPGESGVIADPDDRVLGIEMGRVATRAESRSLAWWWAHEEIHGTPVAATVTEKFRTFKFMDILEPTFTKKLITPGYFQVWSGILQQVGEPFWIDSRTCLFLSLLDSGSLVPIDTDKGEFEATMTLGEMVQAARPETEDDPFLPEGVCSAPSPASNEAALLFWRRSGERLEFLRFNTDFELQSTVSYDIGNLDCSEPVWLSEGRLLVRERDTREYVALSGFEERKQKFAASPFTEEEFEVLGSEFNGDLIALFDSKFWSASEGSETWTEMTLSR
ncbi:MAG: hypothetical protein KC931_17440 [Candidatus Omnitrophica bacterium]|nr:hypothetical protein [Candidatus Omnitrophota bacterium]